MEELVNLYQQIPAAWQLGLFVLVALVALAAHVAPHTKNPYDDKLRWVFEEYGLLEGLKAAALTLFHIVAGNYGKAKNK
jgi:hypothetical protein